jgi:serine/threonine protein phosphatase PrpC
VESWTQFLKLRFTERPEGIASFGETQFSHLMRECFAQAHRQVQKAAPGGSATAAGLCIQGDWLIAGTVGDARAYHLNGEGLAQLTPDQTDAGGNPTDVLGGRSAAPNANSYAARALSPGDWVVACSDGLLKTLSLQELADLLSSATSPQAAARTVQGRAEARQVPDDVTAVFARVVEVGAPFWANGESLTSRTTASPAPPPREKTAPAAERKEPMRSSSDADLKTEELEKRLARLERSPAGGGLSQQEQARLEREFGRLEAEIRDLGARRPSSPNLLMVGVLVLLSLVIGLGAGFGLSGFGKNRAAFGKSGETSAEVKLQEPKDMQRFLGYQTTEQGVILRYRSSEGAMKVAIYRYEDEGAPSVILQIPQDSGGTGASNAPDGSSTSSRELSGATRRANRRPASGATQ